MVEDGQAMNFDIYMRKRLLGALCVSKPQVFNVEGKTQTHTHTHTHIFHLDDIHLDLGSYLVIWGPTNSQTGAGHFQQVLWNPQAMAQGWEPTHRYMAHPKFSHSVSACFSHILWCLRSWIQHVLAPWLALPLTGRKTWCLSVWTFFFCHEVAVSRGK